MRLSLRRLRTSEKELSFHLSLSRFQFHYLPLPLRISELAKGLYLYIKKNSVRCCIRLNSKGQSYGCSLMCLLSYEISSGIDTQEDE